MVVDDSPVFRARACELLVSVGWDVVGEARDAAQALARAAALCPDLVLLDVMLPDADGFVVAHALAAHSPRPAVVLTSAYDEATFAAKLAGVPIAGFVAKHELSAYRLRQVLSGGGWHDASPQ
jgi:DNA-binding NarL/FixJ family response regulator